MVRVGPPSSSSSTYTYPLVVALPAEAKGFANGATAQLEVVLKTAPDVLAVPSSAVTGTGTGKGTVIVLSGGQEKRRSVSVGVLGGVYTQIKSGLAKGATVVLADLAEPVPSSNSASTAGFGGTFPRVGGFGGRGWIRRGCAPGRLGEQRRLCRERIRVWSTRHLQMPPLLRCRAPILDRVLFGPRREHVQWVATLRRCQSSERCQCLGLAQDALRG